MDASAKPLLTPRRAALGALAAGAVGVSAVLVTAYLQREAIGVRFAVDFLRAHGVPAEIHLDRLDLKGAAGSMRLGPWWRPDLVVPHLEMRFKALPSPRRGLAAPQVRALVLIQPVLHGRWKDGRLDFGTLQPLIDQALRARPGGAPPPDLDIRDGRLILDTPTGQVVVALDAALQAGRLRSIHARLEPVDLGVAGVRLAGVEGVVSGQPVGSDHLHLTAAFSAARGHGRGAAADGLTLSLEALAPDSAAVATTGQARPLDLTLRVHAGRLALPGAGAGAARVQGGDMTLDLDGGLDGANRFTGKLRAAGRAQAVGDARVSLQAVSFELKSPAATAGLQAGRPAASGPFTLAVAVQSGRAQTPLGPATLGPSHLAAAGGAQLAHRLSLQVQGGFETAAGLAPDDAERAARGLAGAVGPEGAAALAEALQHARLRVASYGVSYDTGRGFALRLPHGADLALAHGQATLRPLGQAAVLQTAAGGAASGGFGLSARVAGLPQLDLVAREYRLGRAGEASARAEVTLKGDLGPLQDATLSGAAAVAAHAGGWSVTGEGCSDLAATALRSGAKVLASGVRARLCPLSGAPLIAVDPAGWRLGAQVEQAAFALPASAVRGRLAAADVTLQGGRAPPGGQIVLRGLALEDASATPRLRPVTVDGGVGVGGGAVEGRLRLTLTAGAAPLGELTLRQRLDTGAGQAVFASAPLRFDPKGLQPGDILPAAARLLPQAEGALQVQAQASWTQSGLTASSAEASSEGLSFRSPAARIDGVRGQVRLAGLAPLRTEGVQTLQADRLETLVPLTDLKAQFALAPDALELRSASATAADGEVRLDPMRLALSGSAPAPGELRLKGVSLQSLISAFNLSNVVSIQARVDGELPFTLQPAANGAPGAFRLGEGRIYAEGPGRLTIQRQALGAAVATAGAAGAQPNAVQDFAYQALENLAFTRLEADVASRPAGRLGVVFHIAGSHDPKIDKPTRIGLVQLLRGHAFDKPLPLPKGTPVELTLDTSLNLDDLLAAYGALNAPPASAKVQP